MKNVYFIQVGFAFDKSVYLPYATGTIVAYCKSRPELAEEYDFREIIFRRDDIDKIVDGMESPCLAAFSTYVWNVEFNKALAKAVKAKYPECIIVFGGHSVSDRMEFLENEYIDILTLGEGEEVTANLLTALKDGTDLSDCCGIAFRDTDGSKILTAPHCPESVENYPSPYLTGVFDSIIEKNPDTMFDTIIETNRGCPYNCSYCDWSNHKKLRLFPMEKVKGELEWLSSHQIEYCFCADANFGMFDRDIEIAEYIVELNKATGFPKVFRPCYEKNSAERVFQISKILNSRGIDKGATMAYQTLCDEALKNINRKNLTMEHFSDLMTSYTQANIPTYSELILGLPGETAESFCQGICKLLRAGQHNSISVYYCELLPNAPMCNPDYMKKFEIEPMKVKFNHIHSASGKKDMIPEYSYLVRSTSTLSREGWVYANLFSICLQCFHSLGLLRYFAIYAYYELGIDYYDFYTSLLEFCLADEGMTGELFREIKRKLDGSLEGEWNHSNPVFGNVTWFFEEGLYLEFLYNFDEFGKLIDRFVKPMFKGDSLYDELLVFQLNAIKRPFEEGKNFECGYDFVTYFRNAGKDNAAPPEKSLTRYDFRAAKKYEDWPSFAKETVWYGRRKGATLYNIG
ncbi:MAG: radical SAM protein [Clostridia bacterium]|nr:radical SAM protein [Clostridia bacterium]